MNGSQWFYITAKLKSTGNKRQLSHVQQIASYTYTQKFKVKVVAYATCNCQLTIIKSSTSHEYLGNKAYNFRMQVLILQAINFLHQKRVW